MFTNYIYIDIVIVEYVWITNAYHDQRNADHGTFLTRKLRVTYLHMYI